MNDMQYTKDENVQMSYFAQDGNYGNAVALVVVNTANFTEEDWQTIDEARDSERGEVALQISRKNYFAKR